MESPGAGDRIAIDFADAERLLHRTARSLRAARRAGTLRTAFFIRRGEVLPVLDRVEIERIAANTGSGPSTFGRKLYLPAYAIEQLADTAVLRWVEHPFVLETKGIVIRDGEDRRLLERLAIASTDLSRVETVALSTLMRSIGGSEKPYGHVFRALLNGDVPFELGNGNMLLARVRISAKDAMALRTASLARPQYVTFPAPLHYRQMDACDILNLHVRNRDAVLELDHCTRNGGAVFDPATIKQVASERVTAGELAAQRGISAVTVASRLRKNNLMPVDVFGWDRVAALETLRREYNQAGILADNDRGISAR